MNDPAPDLPVFSPRLSEALDTMIKGEAPNAGRFCGYCFTPMGPDRVTCNHCAKSVHDTPPVPKLPSEIIVMFRQMRRRESLVVNSFAQLGIFLGVMSFIALFYVMFLNDVAIWWYTLDVLLLFVLSPVLAGVIGGYFGDNLGYRFARRKLAEEWRVYEATHAERQPSS